MHHLYNIQSNRRLDAQRRQSRHLYSIPHEAYRAIVPAHALWQLRVFLCRPHHTWVPIPEVDLEFGQTLRRPERRQLESRDCGCIAGRGRWSSTSRILSRARGRRTEQLETRVIGWDTDDGDVQVEERVSDIVHRISGRSILVFPWAGAAELRDEGVGVVMWGRRFGREKC